MRAIQTIVLFLLLGQTDAYCNAMRGWGPRTSTAFAPGWNGLAPTPVHSLPRVCTYNLCFIFALFGTSTLKLFGWLVGCGRDMAGPIFMGAVPTRVP